MGEVVLNRRGMLAGMGVTGAAVLAGCGGSDNKGAQPESASSPTTSSAGAGARPLVALARVPVGSAVAAKAADGSPVVVARPTERTAVAFSAICTHQGCTVAPAGTELHCPCHGSRYSATTGKVLQGPAPRPLPSVPVRVSGGQVLPA